MPNVADAWLTTVLGFGTVFLVLIILWAIMELMRVVFYKPEKPMQQKPEEINAAQQINVPVDVDREDETRLVAAITAAIASCLNTNTGNLKIKSFRQVGVKYKSKPTDFGRI